MEYENFATFDELVSDSAAIEFHNNVEYLPTTRTRQEFADWVDTEAAPKWGMECQPMLAALKRLVSQADADYDFAMIRIRTLQDEVGQRRQGTREEADAEQLDPARAAELAAADIAVPIIWQLTEQYPELAARLTAEQLSAAAMKATAAAVSQNS